MKFLVCGGGTIGTTYAYLLSQAYEVELLVKEEQREKCSAGVTMSVKDLRKKSVSYEKTTFYPRCVTEITAEYDGILVAVNRCQLGGILPLLAEKQYHTQYFAFLQNNWNLLSELEPYLDLNRCVIAFPSSVGGGRDNSGVEVILFDESTRLGGACPLGIRHLQKAFALVGIKTRWDQHISDWLKVHYLQQSITAGAVLECGGFPAFAQDSRAVRKMVYAFREGIEVCRLLGVNVRWTFPANLFGAPAFLVSRIMQKMFLDVNTREMVQNHMKKGLSEWIAGYQEVLEEGLAMGLPMSVWGSYRGAVEAFLSDHQEE